MRQVHGDDHGSGLTGVCEHHYWTLRNWQGFNSGHNHSDTQHRQCTGTFTPSGGKSDRQRRESGLSKPQRSVGGCRNETKKTTATASHIKVLLFPKDTREQRDQISSCCICGMFKDNYDNSITAAQQRSVQKSVMKHHWIHCKLC